nr:uncharacterized protein LOC108082682 [Drosophila kikkawai]
MGLVSTFVVILVCFLCILVTVDSKGNKNHKPDDRPWHRRPHNMHRAPYTGYDWEKNGYKRNFD